MTESTSPLPSPSLTSTRFQLSALLPRRPRSRSGTIEDEGGMGTTSPLRRAFSSRSRSASQPMSPGSTARPVPRSGESPSTSLPSTPVGEVANPLEQTPAAPVASTSTSAAVRPGSVCSVRLVPHLDATTRSLHFEPIARHLTASGGPIRIGRFNERVEEGHAEATGSGHIAFKSKVVSRSHAEIWAEDDGRVFVRDTRSSSGTFLNHIRLSGPATESRPFPLRDGDVLQLGVDYQGGTEAMYRCVKIRVELNRAWQRGANAYNLNTFRQLKVLAPAGGVLSRSKSEAQAGTLAAQTPAPMPPRLDSDDERTTCCICLFSVMACQALFIAPCSHVYHYKCILPLLQMHHPGFSCPLCRTWADLNADVELDDTPHDCDSQSSDDDIRGSVAIDRSGLESAMHPSPVRRPSGASSLRHGVASVPDAGIFQADVRRASLVVSGPQGSAAVPITGRSSSRPSSVRHLEMRPSHPVPEGALATPGRAGPRESIGEAGSLPTD